MKVVDIDRDTLVDVHSHESEALGCQAVCAVGIGAHVPLDAPEVEPPVVGDGVHAISKRNTTRGRCAIRMVVCGVDVGVVVEVLHVSIRSTQEWFQGDSYLLHINNVVIVLRKVRSNLASIRLLVARDIIALEDVRETGDVDGEQAQRATGGSSNGANQGRRRETERSKGLHF